MKFLSLFLVIACLLTGCANAVTGGPDAITAEMAKAAALEHAGLSADEVRWIRAEKDLDDRVHHFNVEFYHAGDEYEYEIDAATGNVLKVEKEREN